MTSLKLLLKTVLLNLQHFKTLRDLKRFDQVVESFANPRHALKEIRVIDLSPYDLPALPRSWV